MRVVPVAVLVVVLAGAAACGDDDDTGSTATAAASSSAPTSATTVPPALSTASTTAPPTSQEPTVTSSSPPEPPPSGASTSSSAATAVADLAAHLGIDPGSIIVVDEREVTWPDSSIGCPQPGMQYLQRLTDGVLLVLEAGDRRYEYHAGGSRSLFLCANPRPPVPGG